MPTLTGIRQTVGRRLPLLSWTDFVTGRSGESTSHLEVRILSPRELTAEFVDRWRDLELRSCHSNAFIGPDFLLPAWSLLPANHEPLLIVVRDRTSGQFMALGTFQRCWGSRTLPLPHLVAARTIHSFRTGILVDTAEAGAALEALLRYVRRAGWHGVLLPRMRLDSNLARHLAAATTAAGYLIQTHYKTVSPAVFPPILTQESYEAATSASRRKSLRRGRNWLEGIGPVQLVQITDEAELLPALREFMRLENLGWKGQAQTSVLSSRFETLFLEEMGQRLFQSGRLVATQLRVGDRVVAAAINFIGGNTLFAFKIAWDPEFAKGSPGLIHEYELMSFIRDRFPDVTCIDSCARPDSYVANVWPHDIDVGRVTIGLSTAGKILMRAIDLARPIRSRLRELLRPRQSEGRGASDQSS